MTLATLGSVCARGGSRHTARAGATRPESARANGDANYYFSEINAITPTTDPAAHDSVKPIRVNESRAQKAAGANERARGSKTKRFEKGSSGPSKQPAPPPSALAAVKRPRPPQSTATTGVTDICIYRDLRSDVTVIYSSLSLSTRFVNILTKSHFS